MSDRDRLASIAARGRPAGSGPVTMGQVTEVDVDAGEATVELTDGSTTTLYATGGYLPAVGDQVPLLANGGDLISLVPRHMVDGDLQSKDFVEGVSGWRITAAGDAELNDLVARGDITATTFRTADDPTIDGSVEVTSTGGVGRMIFRASGPLSPTPAGISSPTDDTIQIDAPGFTASVIVGHEDGVYVGGVGVVELVGTDVIINGVSAVRPPHRRMSRSTNVTVATATPTTIVVDTSTLHNLDPTGAPTVDVNLSTGAITPLIAGLWRIDLEAVFEADGAYEAQVGYRLNGTTDLWGPAVPVNGFLDSNPAHLTRLLNFDGSTDSIQPRVRHLAGGDRLVALRRVAVHYVGSTA